jgi:cytochrome P450
MSSESLGRGASLDDLEFPEVDFFGVEYQTDPLAACRAAREKAWAARTPLGPLVVTHADVNELLRYPDDQMVEMDPATMLRPESGEELSTPPLEDWLAAMRLFMGPDSQHVRLRKICSTLFRPSVIDRWRPSMRGVAEHLVDGFRRAGECEFVAQFANLYPAHVFARIIGLPEEEEVPAFARWSGDIGLTFLRPLAPFRERLQSLACSAISRT